jgi:hypothetical protein
MKLKAAKKSIGWSGRNVDNIKTNHEGVRWECVD